MQFHLERLNVAEYRSIRVPRVFRVAHGTKDAQNRLHAGCVCYDTQHVQALEVKLPSKRVRVRFKNQTRQHHKSRVAAGPSGGGHLSDVVASPIPYESSN